MNPVRVSAGAGAACGVLVAAVAGLALGGALGGAWWLVAVVAAGGALAGRVGVLVQSVATLTLVAGGAGAERLWLVPVLVAGLAATAEGGALAERWTGRPQEHDARDARDVLVAPVVAALVAAGVLWLGKVGPGPTVPLALLAAAGAAAVLTALRP